MSAWRKLLKTSLILLLAALPLAAAESHGTVEYGGLPLPGATVTAIEGAKKAVAVTDSQGVYSFPDLADGEWHMRVDMLCFATMNRAVKVAPGAPAENWDMKLLTIDQIRAQATVINTPPPALEIANAAKPETEKKEEPKPAPPAETPPAEANQDASDNFLINGSTNNGAASPFAQSAAFGNNRRNLRGLYNGGIGVILNNSALDAQQFSLTGQATPKPSFNNLTGVATLGGPLRIPHLMPNGPFFFVGYQWTRNSTASTQTGLMPTMAERNGDLSSLAALIYDPTSKLPFTDNMIPPTMISAQARALLNLFPMPNFAGSTRYNYQIPTTTAQHQDAMQLRMQKLVNPKNQLNGSFAFQDTRSDTPNLFSFFDTMDVLGLNANINWRQTLSSRLFGTLGFTYSRLRTRVTPFFENQENVSGNDGITGNDQNPMNWGPPTLNFSSGIAPLGDQQASFNRNQTAGISYSLLWIRGRHNVSIGGDFKRQQFNYLSQQDPRGTFTFTGAATQNGSGTGSDLADFLLGIPDTSSIAFGNADKYFRSSIYDAFLSDDWRVSPELTLNLGVRWEYWSPITELYGRLVNLDIAPGFAAEAPVVASNPVGSVTGQQYPDSLIHPDKHGVQPRISLAWRPISGSSLVVRSGYGVYYNTSVYQTLAQQMAQQSPLSKSLSVQNSAADPLTLANGFTVAPGVTPNTFAVDPNFRVGYAQIWNVAVQRDLPGALVMTATYLGIKGTRGVQEFLPNTYPIGAVNPCPACPVGYIYMTSNGNSTRESGQMQLRRRLHNGFTATLQYTYSKSIDDAALGGSPTGFNAAAPVQSQAVIAQNWLDLAAERGLSTFDQRHLLNLTLQYTTGMGLRGGTLVSGWRGALMKEWTVLTQITAGTGLPLTPIYLAAAPGTGVTGSIRPEYTGAPLYSAPQGLSLNPAAYVAPPPGEWGNAGRDSITGPAQFSMNASLGRTFRLTDRLNLDLRVDSTNALNHVTFPSWNTTVTSAQFGLPMTANAMRSMQTTLRVRF